MDARRRREKDAPHRTSLEDRLRMKIEEIMALSRISRTITSSMNLSKMLGLITRQISRVMKCPFVTVRLMERKHLVLKASFGLKKDWDDFRADVPLKDNFIALAVRRKRSYTIKDLWEHPESVLYPIAKKYGLRSLLAVPLIEKEVALGTIGVYGRMAGTFSKEDEEELKLFASQIAVAAENAKLLESAKQNYLNVMRLLASVIDAKDRYTEDHSERVVKFALGIAHEMGIEAPLRENIKYASFLHDIGKINIDADILQKAGPLTKEEWEKMREHPKTSSSIIAKAGFLDELIPIILYHHVRFGGGGYPLCGKKGAAIPVGARILSVADAYEAMTSDRPYRRRLSRQEAASELRRCAGTQFDPDVVKAFLRFLNRKKKNHYGLW